MKTKEILQENYFYLRYLKKNLLFRGKKAFDGKWVFGYLFDNGVSCRIIPVNSALTEWNVLTDFNEVDPKTVGIYVGYKDNSNNEIFTGDILEFVDKWEWYRDGWAAKFMFASQKELIKVQKEYDELPTHKRVVEFDFENGVNFSVYDLGEKRWKVIGNIFENTELLK